MDYTLLKEFLESDMTQKEFAIQKNVKQSVISKKLWFLLNKLYMDGLHDPGPYAYEVRYARKHKEKLLKAINNLYQ